MYQDNTYMIPNGTQWYSLPLYYTAAGHQQNLRVQTPVTSYLTPETSVGYRCQSEVESPVHQYMAPQTTNLQQYGLTQPQYDYHYKPSETFNESSSERYMYSYQNYPSSFIIYGTQATYAKKDHSLEAFVRAICVGDLGLNACTGGSQGSSQDKIRKQYGNYSLKDPRIRRMVSRARNSPYKRPGQSKNHVYTKYKANSPSTVTDRDTHEFPVLDAPDVEKLCSDFLKCSMLRPETVQ